MEKPIIAKSTKKIAPSKKSHVFCGFFHHFHYATVCFVHELPNPKNPAKMLQAQEVRSPGKKLMAFGSFPQFPGRKKTKKIFETINPVHPQFLGVTSINIPSFPVPFFWGQLQRRDSEPLTLGIGLKAGPAKGRHASAKRPKEPTVLEPKKRGQKHNAGGSIDELTHARHHPFAGMPMLFFDAIFFG